MAFVSGKSAFAEGPLCHAGAGGNHARRRCLVRKARYSSRAPSRVALKSNSDAEPGDGMDAGKNQPNNALGVLRKMHVKISDNGFLRYGYELGAFWQDQRNDALLDGVTENIVRQGDTAGGSDKLVAWSSEVEEKRKKLEKETDLLKTQTDEEWKALTDTLDLFGQLLGVKFVEGKDKNLNTAGKLLLASVFVMPFLLVWAASFFLSRALAPLLMSDPLDL
ncbi:hypothetical protein FVE85_5825 [Porphyridium purpureum]|uniref:Uncharacterized protein n=1 Tax=Porphyridium purpureum TaxID=35688 RepID=A0A5J4Z4T6_PORPP|nr:hypothetical protein FVE85_5825 [Porphyridium purpureum]|eukprot:POR6297..scf295_1